MRSDQIPIKFKYVQQKWTSNFPIPTEHSKSIRKGKTVATNALLERKGERIEFVTPKGFDDILEIGNQSREKIFDLKFEKPTTNRRQYTPFINP